ncbi:tetratricopeptide repeat protein [bacterium]|nr:tetratricopeptide repeat protein [bacterium]
MSIPRAAPREGALALFLVLLSLVAYARALPAPYMWDDVSLIADNPALEDPANILRYFVEDLGHFNQSPRDMGFYRPMQALTFHLEAMTFGKRAPVHRAINALWHGVAAASIFFLARAFALPLGVAFFTGLLFVLHPLATEQVALVANRGGVMAGALYLAVLALLARAATNGELVILSRPFVILSEAKDLATRRTTRAFALALALYAIALLTKDEALTLAAPAAALAFFLPAARIGARKEILCFAQDDGCGERLRLAARLAGPVAALALAYVVWRWFVLDISHGGRIEVTFPLATRVAAIPAIALKAFALAFVPTNLRAIRTADIASLASPGVAIGATLVWIAIFFAAWRARRAAPIVPFAALLFAATMAPSSGLVPLLRPIAEHYYYLPTAAMCLAMGGVIGVLIERPGWRIRRGIAVGAASAVVVIFGVMTWQRLGAWTSEEALWRDNFSKEPRNTHVMNNLGTLAAIRGDSQEAFQMFRAAAFTGEPNPKALANLARAAIDLGQYPDAARALDLLLANRPKDRKAWFSLGRLSVRAATDSARDRIESIRARAGENADAASVFDTGVAYERSQIAKESSAP